MDPLTRVVYWLVKPLKLLPGGVWGRFWWWYWERRGISREEQWQLIEEAEARESELDN